MWGSWKACAPTYFVQTWRECWYTHNLLWIKQLSLSSNNIFQWKYKNTLPLWTKWNRFWQVIPVTLRNGWQKEEKDAGKKLVCDMFCRVIYLTLICSVVVLFFFYKKNLCQGCWRLVESFFKQNYCHAFETKFAVFFPLPSCCVCSPKINHIDSRKQQNAGSGTSRLGN